MNRAREKWKKTDPERYKRYVRNCNFKRKYGISVEEYDSKLAKQGDYCAACETETPGNRGFFLDHDHKTGDLREFICQSCNTALGAVRDDPEVLRKLIDYLRRHGRI